MGGAEHPAFSHQIVNPPQSDPVSNPQLCVSYIRTIRASVVEPLEPVVIPEAAEDVPY
jgi:hypothetical protein